MKSIGNCLHHFLFSRSHNLTSLISVMAIEEAKNPKTITTEELLGFLITHEHTLQRDKKKKEVDKKKKKDHALQLLMGGGE